MHVLVIIFVFFIGMFIWKYIENLEFLEAKYVTVNLPETFTEAKYLTFNLTKTFPETKYLTFNLPETFPEAKYLTFNLPETFPEPNTLLLTYHKPSLSQIPYF